MDLEDLHLTLRTLRPSDYPQLKVLMDKVYDDIGGAWPKKTINRLIGDFPDGQLAIGEAGICPPAEPGIYDGDDVIHRSSWTQAIKIHFGTSSDHA